MDAFYFDSFFDSIFALFTVAMYTDLNGCIIVVYLLSGDVANAGNGSCQATENYFIPHIIEFEKYQNNREAFCRPVYTFKMNGIKFYKSSKVCITEQVTDQAERLPDEFAEEYQLMY